MLYLKTSSQWLWMPPVHICKPKWAVDMCKLSCGFDSGATTDADMLNPVGFSEKMKTTGMSNLPDRSVTWTQLVLHRAKDSP